MFSLALPGARPSILLSFQSYFEKVLDHPTYSIYISPSYSAVSTSLPVRGTSPESGQGKRLSMSECMCLYISVVIAIHLNALNS